MNVPLIANAITIRNKEKINLWYNGTNKIVDTGVKPYFYSYTDLGFPAEKETVDGIALSNYQKRKFVKYQFDTRKQMIDYIRHGETFEDEISKSSDMFVLRNRLDIPDLFTKFPHTNELKFLFFDIEQFTKPGIKFPTYDDRIVSVSWCTNNRDIKTICLKKETPTDKELLEKFIEAYEKIDPDVLVVYNKKYDIPTILQRCMINRLNTAKFSKNDRKPVIGKNNIPYIDGIVVYDVYDSAREDQSLSGNVEDRGLKEVSNYFGFKEERKPLDVKKISEYLGSSELVEYNRDDVKRLLLLFDIYWPGIEFNANDLKIPLNLAVGMNITKLGIICMGDEYKKRNVIADGSNYDRYPEIFQRKKKQIEPNYQGAIVGISKIGYFAPVYKADYSSMYPTIMSSFNLSPDTTTLLMFAPYDKFKIEEEENAFIYYIPDDVLKKTMVIQVSKSSGFLALLVKKFLDERAEYKKLYKATRDRKHESASNNRKVKANGGVYGNQGAANHPFGFAPIAIATCGFGREAGQMLIDILNEIYHDCVISVDTDGVHFSTNNVDENKITEILNKRLEEKFKKKLDLTIDIDKYDSGYFYKSKNYVLKRGDKIIKHGVAMKAQNKNLLSKSLIDELAYARVNNKSINDIQEKYLKLDLPLEHFAMNVTMGMELHEYKNKNDLVSRLARMAEKELGIKPQIENKYYYVKEKNDYTLLELASRDRLDIDYYRSQVKRILEMFDASIVIDSIDNWV